MLKYKFFNVFKTMFLAELLARASGAKTKDSLVNYPKITKIVW